MTFDELKKEYGQNFTETIESEIILEPIIKNNQIIGVVQKFYCPNCEEFEIEQIFTACLDDDLEDFVHENGFRDLY